MTIIIHKAKLIWRNPYITHGLVSMWDGEWNAGGGIHDPAATSWPDLVSGLTLRNFAADGRHMRATDSGETIVLPPTGDRFTVEIYSNNVGWYAPVGSQTYNYILLKNVKDKRVTAISLCLDAFETRFTYGLDSSGYDLSVLRPVKMDLHAAATFDGTAAHYYIGGELKSTRIPTANAGVPHVLKVGFPNVTSSTTLLSAIRLYDRALDPEEIAQNAAVDRERFV